MGQHQWRLYLRINGFKCNEDESSEECIGKVKSLLKDEIPDMALDRAHRISQVRQNATNYMKYQPLIVRFITCIEPKRLELVKIQKGSE